MKPIEPNCRAKVIGLNQYEGKVVIVGRYCGLWNDKTGDIGEPYWETDSTFTNQSGTIVTYLYERNLQRIDDDDVALGSWEELSEIWSPKELVV